jgi:hypothetical protein
MTIAQYLRLKDNHPTMVKLNKLYDLAKDLGITISFNGHVTVVHDNDRDDLPHLRLEDMDSNDSIKDWPPASEFMVIYENPAHIAERKQLFEQQMAEIKRLVKEADERDAIKKQEQEVEHLRKVEEQERAKLVELKAKYEV